MEEPQNSQRINRPLDDVLIGTIFGDRYRVDSLLGSGGWGNVYKCIHLGLDIPFAIKTLHPHFARDSNCCQRLEQEARVLSRIDSPYLVKTIDHGLAPVPYLVMEFFEGTPLSGLLADNYKFSHEDALVLFEQLTEGLKAVHAAGMVHRDLKPSNILVKTRPGLKAKIVDLGIVKVVDSGDEKITMTGEIIGSPPYMAPEQWQGGGTDNRTDIYALGCVMYEVLTGKPCFRASQSFEYLNLHLNVQPQRFAREKGLLAGLQQIVLKCLEKRPNERYPSAELLLLDLYKLKSGQKLKSTFKESVRQWGTLYGGIALALVSIGTLGYFLSSPIITQICESKNKEADTLLKKGETEKAIASYQETISLSGFLEKQAEVRLHALKALREVYGVKGSFAISGEYEQLFKQAVGEPAFFPQIIEKRTEGDKALAAGELSRAIELRTQAVRMAEEEAGKNSLVYSDCLNDLADLLRQTGHYKSSLEIEQASLRIAEFLLGNDDPRIAVRLNVLGQDFRALRRFDEAIKAFKRAAEINRKSGPKDAIGDYDNLAMVYVDMRNYNQAIENFKIAAALSEQLSGKKDISIMNNMACTYISMRDYAKGEELFKQGFDLGKSRAGSDAANTLELGDNLAEYYFKIGKLDEAKAVLADTLELEKYAPNNLHISRAKARLKAIAAKERAR